MSPVEAEPLYDKFCNFIAVKDINIQTGRFGAKMSVELTNDGPVTIILEN